MRGFLVLAARILVSGALLYFALRGVDFAGIQARLTQTSTSWFFGWMGISVLVYLVQVAFGAMRWREISRYCQAPLDLRQAFRFNLIGTFFNQTLPSTIGGDAVRLWLVNRTGASWRAATYSVLVDRAIGLIALAIIVVISLPWSFDLIRNERGRVALILVDVAAMSAGLGFLLVSYLPWKWLKTWWPTRHIHACSVIANQVIFNRTSGPRIAILSISIHILTVVIAWCAVQSISAPAGLEQTFLLIPPIALITMLPISIAGWGVREATMMVAFGYAGLSQTDGTMISLLSGATSFVVGAIGGLVWILSREKAEKMPDVLPAVD
jgi:uncharacterized membrane protein YbhN (UPF0104 family)